MHQEINENRMPSTKPSVKPPLYRSPLTKSLMAKSRQKSDQHHHQTMGYAEVPLNPPSNFLKKNSRKVTIPQVEKNKTWCYVKSVPQPPGTGEAGKPWKTLQSAAPKNFIRAHHIDVMRMVPPLPKPKIQDTRNGHSFDLTNSGLVPKYLMKKTYGKKPKYLTQMNKEHDIKKRLEAERIVVSKPLSPLRLISDEERSQMIKGLEKKMKDDYKVFYIFPMINETISMIRRKEQYRKAIEETEKKIDLLTRHKTIYVSRNA